MGYKDQLMIGKETTHGSYAAPTRSLEVDDAKFTPVYGDAQGGGLMGAGYHVNRAARHTRVTRKATGEATFDARTRGLGLILDQICGSNPTPTQIGATDAYSQTHTLAHLGVNHGATIQVGLTEAESGDVNPYTYLGSRMTQLTVTQASAEDATLKIGATWDCQDVTQGQALASFTASAAGTFHLGQFGYKAHNTPGSEAAVAGVRGMALTIARPQDVERWGANLGGLRGAPILNGRDEVLVGTITCDYLRKEDFADRFMAHQFFAQIFEWVGPEIDDGEESLFRIALPSCVLLGPLPPADGPAIISGEFAFAALDNDTAEPLTMTYVSADTAL